MRCRFMETGQGESLMAASQRGSDPYVGREESRLYRYHTTKSMAWEEPSADPLSRTQRPKKREGLDCQPAHRTGV